MRLETVSAMSQEALGCFSGMYAHMRALYGEDACSYSARKWGQIRRWMEKEYFPLLMEHIDRVTLGDYLGKQASNEDLLAFLQACEAECLRRIEERRQAFFDLVPDFPACVREILWNTLESAEVAWVTKQDGRLCFYNDEYPAFRYRFLLDGAENILGDIPECIWHIKSLEKRDEGYCLIGTPIEQDWEDSPPISVPFTEIRFERETHRVEFPGYFERPWAGLGRMALAICEKAFYSDCLCNEQEQALLPLLSELANLYQGRSLPEKEQVNHFPLLAQHFEQYGQKRLLPLLSKLEAAEPYTTRYYFVQGKLAEKLNEQACEPLWRDIFRQITQSQAAYPSRTEAECEPELLMRKRAEIQAHMERRGYCGTYPDYTKEGPLRGLHLADSYNMVYLVGMEKHAVYHIHCVEAMDCGRLELWFLCGTALPRKGEQAADIWACSFNAGGRRLFNEVGLLNHWDSTEADLVTLMDVAVKKAELQRLTKAERERLCMDNGGLPGLFLGILILGGGLFGLLMTVGFMVIELAAAILCGQFAAFPGLFLSTPWWQILLFCWVAYGGVMGWMAILARRK